MLRLPGKAEVPAIAILGMMVRQGFAQADPTSVEAVYALGKEVAGYSGETIEQRKTWPPQRSPESKTTRKP